MQLSITCPQAPPQTREKKRRGAGLKPSHMTTPTTGRIGSDNQA